MQAPEERDEKLPEHRPSVIAEMVGFLRDDVRWWLGGVVIVVAVLSAAIVATESKPIMPYFYELVGADG